MKTSLLRAGLSFTAVLASLSVFALEDELAPPFRAEAGGQFIDVEVGHAAPLMVDFDGDGVRDLLVGQFGEGKLRIYRNIGSNVQPKFERFAWFRAGWSEGKVPAG